MEIPNKIQEEIRFFCKNNNIEDVDKFLLKILRNGFNIAKYGMGPSSIVIAPKEEVEIKHEINPISLEVPKQLQDVIDLQSKVDEVKKEILNTVKIPEEKINNKKRDLYDEE